jgi:hypothetical protein
VSKFSQDFSMEQAKKLAESPVGQQLLSVLRAQNGDALQKAMDQATAGDFGSVKATMAEFLRNPQVQALLRQLGE